MSLSVLQRCQNHDIADPEPETTPALEPPPADVHAQLSFSEVYGIERMVYAYEEVSDDESTDATPLVSRLESIGDYNLPSRIFGSL